MKGYISLVFICFCFGTNYVSSLQLNSNGGYDIVIAIEENTPLPTIGVGTYRENIKKTLQILSNQLWRATNEVFFINSAELLLPSSWESHELDGIATDQSFTTADLRLSENIIYPYAENSHQCGKAGEFIGLPAVFFDTGNAGAYGPSWKALINLWARYRWGVWDEHGYIGESATAKRFSYSYKPVGTSNWAVTGCSDAPLEGSFVNHIDNDVVCPSNDPLIPPSNECRFKPGVNNTATTSLMHFHWLDSVDSFCDHTNHNKLAPNKQNLYCDHRSIKEVMITTPDYLTVTDPSTSVPVMTFKTVRSSQKPLFYLLIDRGRIEGQMAIATKIPPGLVSLFTRADKQDTVASVGSYPGNVSQGSYVTEEVPWSLIGENQDNFLETIGHLDVDGAAKRDFGLAIKEVIGKIKIQKPAHGAVIMVVKYGSAGPTDEASFADITPEAEVLSELLENNILLCSMELAKSPGPSRSHLVNLARETGGLFTTLDNPWESDGRINQLVNFVHNSLNSQDTSILKNTKTLIKGRTNSPISIPVPRGIESSLQIVYTTPADLSTANFTVRDSATGDAVVFTLEKYFDWNEETDSGKKYAYTLRIRNTLLTDIDALQMEVICPENEEQCAGSTVASAAFNEATSENVDIILSTSSESNTIDLASQTAFAIFAKVTKNSKPISNVVVSAVISQFGNSTTETVDLVDDGHGSPDIEKDDGVYSAYYIPTVDGSFKISVSVQIAASGDTPSTGFVGRLLPIDQDDFGCGASGTCTKETIEGSYVQTIDFPTPVVFTGSANFLATPSKINDLTFEQISGSAYLVWTSPVIAGNSKEKVSRYEIRQAKELENLLTDFQNCDIVGENSPQRPVNPGATQNQSIPVPTETTYFAVRPFFFTQLGGISNIVTAEPRQDEGTTTTTTTTTGTPPTTTTTTQGTTPGDGTTTPDPVTPNEDDKKPWIERPVGYITIIVIILAVFAVAGGGYWFMKKKRSKALSKQSTSQEVIAVKKMQPEEENKV